MEVFVDSHLKLLELERQEEIDNSQVLLKSSPKVLESKGLCLQRMRLSGMRTGLYGKTVVEFDHTPPRDLPANTFSSGDLVGIYSERTSFSGEATACVSSVMLRVSPRSATVVLDEASESETLEEDGLYRLVKLGSDITFKRIKKGLQQLLTRAQESPAAHLVEILFGCSQQALTPVLPELQFYNEKLDDSQREAVAFALARPDVSVIHGPPGTGKTTTLVELVRQAVQGRKMRLLACAPSNVAVDNLLERLASAKPPLRLVRLGHAARVLPHVQKFSLDAQLAASDAWQLVQDVRKEMDETRRTLSGRRDPQASFRLRHQLSELRRELREREAKALREIFECADVVLSTLTGLHEDKTLAKIKFDLTLIDESSQSVEAACWLALLRAPRCVIAGDHLQLPPTVLSKAAAAGGLELSLMERLLRLYPGEEVTRLLTTQYRMHEAIMCWSGRQFYDGKLTAHPSVAQHALLDLPHVHCEEEEDEEEVRAPIVLVDTAGCGLSETQVELSRGNAGEADLVLVMVRRRLKEFCLREDEVGVITPYNLQVEFIRNRVKPKHPKVEVKTVDGFQGREKEVIILSLVRSNDSGEVGFLAEHRRLNVAVTRARRQLVVVCDSDTLSRGKDTVIRGFVDYLRSTASCVRSAQEFIDNSDIDIGAVRPEDLTSIENDSKSGGRHAPKKSKPKAKVKKTSGETNELRKSMPKVNNSAVGKNSAPGEDLSSEVLAFFRSPDTEKVFPDSLAPFQRAAIHELAEQLNLVHFSVGEGKDRHLVLRKRCTADGATATVQPEEEKRIGEEKEVGTRAEASAKNKELKEKEEKKKEEEEKKKKEEEEEKKKKEEEEKKKEVAEKEKQKEVAEGAAASPEDPILRQLREYQEEQRSRRQQQQQQQQKTKLKARVGRQKAKGKLLAADDDDFEALLAAARASDASCSFSECSAKVTTLGRGCGLCGGRYCFPHALPEAHGCGEAARSQARRTVAREGCIHPGSGLPSKLPDPTRRAHLERRMDKKLGDMASQRKAKTKKKES